MPSAQATLRRNRLDRNRLVQVRRDGHLPLRVSTGSRPGRMDSPQLIRPPRRRLSDSAAGGRCHAGASRRGRSARRQARNASSRSASATATPRERTRRRSSVGAAPSAAIIASTPSGYAPAEVGPLRHRAWWAASTTRPSAMRTATNPYFSSDSSAPRSQPQPCGRARPRMSAPAFRHQVRSAPFKTGQVNGSRPQFIWVRLGSTG